MGHESQVVTPHIREIVLAIEDTHMNTPTAVQLLRNSLDRFLAKDMKGWTESVSYTHLTLPTNREV